MGKLSLNSAAPLIGQLSIWSKVQKFILRCHAEGARESSAFQVRTLGGWEREPQVPPTPGGKSWKVGGGRGEDDPHP